VREVGQDAAYLGMFGQYSIEKGAMASAQVRDALELRKVVGRENLRKFDR
jgi:hypothetical protein